MHKLPAQFVTALRESEHRIRMERGWFPLLLPLVPVYGLIWEIWHSFWKIRSPYRPSVFTVGVGNLTVGGTGKTPLVNYLASFFRLQNLRVGVFSRGWGRREKGFLKVDPNASVQTVGDEPLLLARRLEGVDVWVGRNRGALLKAQGDAYDVAILDDAFQHRPIQPHLQLLLFDRRSLQSPRMLLPAGPYREPFSQARRADAFVLNHKSDPVDRSLEEPLKGFSRPIFHVRYASVYLFRPQDGEAIPLEKWSHPVYAFCGIADPLSFLHMLKRAGVEVRGFRTFPDHHCFLPKELDALQTWAGDTPLVTTEKDWVRFQVAWSNLWVVRIEIEELPRRGGALTDFLDTRWKAFASSVDPPNPGGTS